MPTEVREDDWYAEACRRARAYGRRRRAAKASTEWPAFAPPVALSEGPLGAVQAADREIGRQTAIRARAHERQYGLLAADPCGFEPEPFFQDRRRQAALVHRRPA